MMKNFAVLFLAAIAFTACKNNDAPIAPDQIQQTTADSTRVDTIASSPISEQESVNNEKEPVIEVVSKNEDAPVKVEYATFGSKIIADKALSKQQMLSKYKSMKKGDTLAVKFKSTITDVCKKKGCWMKMDLMGEKESFVRFKDYGFFVPMNADNSDAIVSGRAYIDEISVDELKHYAKDGGKSQEEIDKITAPKITYAFQADGVLIQR